MTGFVERISSFERLRMLEPEWRSLEERARPSTPFPTSDWAAAWWSHLREHRFGVRDRLNVRAVRSRNGDLIGIAPLITTLRPGVGSMGVRQLHYLGSDSNITELRGALTRPGEARWAYAALLDDLRASAGEWDFLTLSAVPAEADLEGALRTRFKRVAVVREISNFHVTLAPTWSEF
jgi:CelD/BcsL family acetyltransferase involved in cellulose biosynthesis